MISNLIIMEKYYLIEYIQETRKDYENTHVVSKCPIQLKHVSNIQAE